VTIPSAEYLNNIYYPAVNNLQNKISTVFLAYNSHPYGKGVTIFTSSSFSPNTYNYSSSDPLYLNNAACARTVNLQHEVLFYSKIRI
jgi:hypothetical protein